MTDLDKTLRELTGYTLQRATGSAMIRYKKVFAKFGLRRTTFSCLSLIVDNPGLRQNQLGEALAIERPNLVKIVDDLSNAGLIKRETSKSDRRAYALSATEKGKELFKEALSAVQDLDAQITHGMTQAEIESFRKALSIIDNNTKKH